MSNAILTQVLELKLTGLPSVFDAHQLEDQATNLLQDLCTLLDTKALLRHTVLTHAFRLVAGDCEKPGVLLVIGLTLSNQRILDFHYKTRSLGEMEQSILEDRQKVVNACKNLPTQSALVAVEFSQRISAACLNLPLEDLQPELSRRLQVLLGVRRRNWHGVLADHPWQHQLPAIAKYEWRSELLGVRVQLQREKRGFSLRLMRPDSLPTLIQSVKKLRMPERPADIDQAAILDRAEYTRTPIDMVIRAGSRPGSDQLIVADFVGFRPAVLALS